MRLHEVSDAIARPAMRRSRSFPTDLSVRRIVAWCLNMIPRRLQSIFAALFFSWAASLNSAELQTGGVHRLTFRDVDGNDLSTADGHITIVTVVTRQNEQQAHTVADQVPGRYVGNPKYRYVTLVNFQRKLVRPLHGLTQTIIRRRLDAEAKELEAQYDAKQLTHDPRKDLYVVADFDGTAMAQLGLSPESNDVAVFVFNAGGKLVGRWAGVPPENAVAKAIAAAE